MVLRTLKDKLSKTRDYLHKHLGILSNKKYVIDNDALDELEAILIQSDIGVRLTQDILENVANKKRFENNEEVFYAIRKIMAESLNDSRSTSLNINENGPTIVLVLGVNGSGKTTAIAKLVKILKDKNKKVLLAAADTFRAAAIEQLEIWAKKLDVNMIKHAYNSDPSAVSYDAVNAAISRKVDYLIIDTAGRFQSKTFLIDELKKIDRTINKLCPGAPHEKLLVIDATTGQNALFQAKEFDQAIKVTGIIVNKLDGTAKGGVLLNINKELGIPIKYIGIGQDLDDLEVFDKNKFIEAII